MIVTRWICSYKAPAAGGRTRRSDSVAGEARRPLGLSGWTRPAVPHLAEGAAGTWSRRSDPTEVPAAQHTKGSACSTRAIQATRLRRT